MHGLPSLYATIGCPAGLDLGDAVSRWQHRIWTARIEASGLLGGQDRLSVVVVSFATSDAAAVNPITRRRCRPRRSVCVCVCVCMCMWSCVAGCVQMRCCSAAFRVCVPRSLLWHSLLTCSVSFGQNGKSNYQRQHLSGVLVTFRQQLAAEFASRNCAYTAAGPATA